MNQFDISYLILNEIKRLNIFKIICIIIIIKLKIFFRINYENFFFQINYENIVFTFLNKS